MATENFAVCFFIRILFYFHQNFVIHPVSPDSYEFILKHFIKL